MRIPILMPQLGESIAEATVRALNAEPGSQVDSGQEIIDSERLFLGHFLYQARVKRTEFGPDAEQVLGHFEERMQGLSEEQAVAEAGRCMSCGMCFECDNCVIFCPQDAVFRVKKDKKTMGRYVDTDYTRCIGCHICADVCPTGYIDMGMGE